MITYYEKQERDIKKTAVRKSTTSQYFAYGYTALDYPSPLSCFSFAMKFTNSMKQIRLKSSWLPFSLSSFDSLYFESMRCIPGKVYVPLRMDSLGSYMRIINLNVPGGAGNQLDSRSFPGGWCWMWISNEPAASYLRPDVLSPMEKRLIGFGVKKARMSVISSYMVRDQNALTGGMSSLLKCSRYREVPDRPLPSLSIYALL